MANCIQRQHNYGIVMAHCIQRQHNYGLVMAHCIQRQRNYGHCIQRQHIYGHTRAYKGSPGCEGHHLCFCIRQYWYQVHKVWAALKVGASLGCIEGGSNWTWEQELNVGASDVGAGCIERGSIERGSFELGSTAPAWDALNVEASLQAS